MEDYYLKHIKSILKHISPGDSHELHAWLHAPSSAAPLCGPGLFTPGASSTPEATSTPKGRTLLTSSSGDHRDGLPVGFRSGFHRDVASGYD